MVMLSPRLRQAIALSQAGRNDEAVAILRQLAAANEPAALAMLAEVTWRGGMVPQDPVAARDLFRRASMAGHAQATRYYTNLLASGVAGARSWSTAIERLRREAASDRGRATIMALIDAMNLDEAGDPLVLPSPRQLSIAPQVALYPRAFAPAECDYLRGIAEPLYQPSVVNDSTGRLVRDPIRTSDGATLHWLIEDPAVHALNRRLAALSGSAWETGEALQVLRYRPGEEYRPHLDFVRASDNVRVLTALVYLNDDYRGGETLFTGTGLKVKGCQGDVLIFRNARGDGAVDPLSRHAGAPVEDGVKFVASRWIRSSRWVV
jgi:prolyl 4-hydroxylase